MTPSESPYDQIFFIRPFLPFLPFLPILPILPIPPFRPVCSVRLQPDGASSA